MEEDSSKTTQGEASVAQVLKDERLDLEYCRHAARELTRLKLQGKGMTEELETKIAEWTCGLKVFAPPLEVGQTVLAVHPRFHSPYMGNILIVERSRCRVQFARPELGVELVRDVDIMPVNVRRRDGSHCRRHRPSKSRTKPSPPVFAERSIPCPRRTVTRTAPASPSPRKCERLTFVCSTKRIKPSRGNESSSTALREKNERAEEFRINQSA